MTPFRTSLPGRIISLSIAFALISGGLIPILGLPPATWLPYTFLIPTGACIFATVLSVEDHAGWAVVLAIALPLVLWPYSMVAIWVTGSHPQFAWVLIAAGAVMTVLTAAGSFKRSAATATDQERRAAA